MTSIRFHISKVVHLLKGLSLRKKQIIGVLLPYYIVTISSSLLEGVGMLLLVNLFTGVSTVDNKNEVLAQVFDFINALVGSAEFPDIIPFLIALFSILFVMRFGLYFFNGVLLAFLRRRIQEVIFKHYLLGDWSHMRNFRVGNAVGTCTQEAGAVNRYLYSIVQAIYFALSALTIAGLAILASLKISLILGVIALPLVWLMQKAAKIMARLSKLSAVLRNEFSSDITDQFNGLLQIHVDHNYDFHLRQGLQIQDRLTRTEILTGICQATIGSFGILLPLSALVGFSIWIFFMGGNAGINLALIAGVGVLGIRVASQLSGTVAALGNLARVSGSLYPVLDALNIPPRPARKMIDEPVVRIEIKKVNYAYEENLVIDEVALTIEKGIPLVLSGRSGKGKTTLANLIAGLYFPSKGQVLYVGASGMAFSSTDYRTKVGFVTQDIYLFQDSLRSNLVADRDCTDEHIWEVLEQVDAAEFVRAMGGLDTESAEAGRSLSGGQRRRLGIARVLLSGSNILIFDEVTAGLDSKNKTAVLNVIERLSETFIVVVIAHEKLSLSRQKSYSV